MDYLFLQHFWWFIISLLGALLFFLLFVQGGQTLLYQVGKNDLEQKILLNTLGRKWEFTYTTLVTFGGAFFAAFPLFYATSFGGAYWLWMIILLCFTLQAVSYEFRMKKGNFLGKRVYEAFLLINGFGGIILLGVAVGGFFSGSEFLVNRDNLTNPLQPTISSWGNSLHGLETIVKPMNLLLGLSILFLARIQAALYFINSIDHKRILARSRRQILYNFVPFLLFFLVFLVWVLVSEGYAVDVNTGEISLIKGKYWLNLTEQIWLLAVLLIGVALVLYGSVRSLIQQHFKKGIWYTGAGTIFTALALFLMTGFNNTAFYPSLSDPQSSLTIYNASSSAFTLKVMAYASLLIPIVATYIFFAWRSLNRKPIDADEMQSSEHSY